MGREKDQRIMAAKMIDVFQKEKGVLIRNLRIAFYLQNFLRIRTAIHRGSRHSQTPAYFLLSCTLCTYALTTPFSLKN